MPDKNETAKRKHLRDNLRKKADEEFESSLAISRQDFKNLFDYLDRELTDKPCDDTNRLTRVFLEQAGVSDSKTVLSWLADKGGYCDSEVLNNVEEQFG